MISAYLDIRKTPLLNSLPHPSIINQSRILNILSSAITATSSDQHSPYSKSICPQPPYLSVREDTPIPHPNSHPPRLFFTTLPSTARNQSVPMHFPTHHSNPLPSSPPPQSPPTHLIYPAPLHHTTPHHTTPHPYRTPNQASISSPPPQPCVANKLAKNTYQKYPSHLSLSLYISRNSCFYFYLHLESKKLN